MADGMYVAMTGATARAEQLDSISDNLANAQTPGFKAGRPAFESLLPTAAGPDGDKAYVMAAGTGTDLRPGLRTRTNNPLDVVPSNNAFLSVQMADGSQAYTRNGRLSVGPDGVMRAGQHIVLSRDGTPITIPRDTTPQLDAQGVITAGGQQVGRLGLFQLQGGVDRLGASLLAPNPATGSATPVDVNVDLGELEQGNANALEATVALVTAQRHYENAMQAIQTYRTIDQRANELGKVR